VIANVFSAFDHGRHISDKAEQSARKKNTSISITHKRPDSSLDDSKGLFRRGR